MLFYLFHGHTVCGELIDTIGPGGRIIVMHIDDSQYR